MRDRALFRPHEHQVHLDAMPRGKDREIAIAQSRERFSTMMESVCTSHSPNVMQHRSAEAIFADFKQAAAAGGDIQPGQNEQQDIHACNDATDRLIDEWIAAGHPKGELVALAVALPYVSGMVIQKLSSVSGKSPHEILRMMRTANPITPVTLN